jgi:ABC-type antimicrobial peptide transport system permease subunit
VWAIDPEQTVTGTQTLDELLRGSVADRRFNLALMLSFAGLALGLAMVGCYAVVAYAAAQRTREVGIRLAFGASRREVTALIVKSEMRWSLLGVGVGLSGAIALSRFMKGLLFEIAPTDPWTFVITAATLLAVAFLASVLPARRAACIDPMQALRVE